MLWTLIAMPTAVSAIICRPVLPTHSVPYSAAGRVALYNAGPAIFNEPNSNYGQPTLPLVNLLRPYPQLDHTLRGPPYNLSFQDRPFLRPRAGYRKTIEDDFHWHLQILPQIVRVTGVEWASGFFFNPVPPEIAAQCLSA
jgi:hypothetical protein